MPVVIHKSQNLSLLITFWCLAVFAAELPHPLSAVSDQSWCRFILAAHAFRFSARLNRSAVARVRRLWPISSRPCATAVAHGLLEIGHKRLTRATDTDIADTIAKEVEERKKIADEKLNRQRRENAQVLRKEEADIKESEKWKRNILSSSGSLLQEAEAKLNEAIKAGDLDKIAVMNDLLEISHKRLS